MSRQLRLAPLSGAEVSRWQPTANGVKFVQGYHFNIAAYELAKLLGLTNMMPVRVERKWAGKTGA